MPASNGRELDAFSGPAVGGPFRVREERNDGTDRDHLPRRHDGGG